MKTTTSVSEVNKSVLIRLGVENVQVKYRNLDEFRNEPLWMFNFSIYGGKRTYTLDWKALGLKSETLEYLKKKNFKAPKIPFLDILNSYVIKLNSYAKKKLKNGRLMRYAEPNWFTNEVHLEEIAKYFQRLKRRRTIYVTKLLSLYQSKKADSALIVSNLLTTTDLEQREQDAIVARFLKAFPTPEQIQGDFFIEITQLIKIPSITEQAQIDAQLAEAELVRHTAKASLELHKEYKQGLQNKLSTVIQSATDEFCGILAETLPKLATVGEGHLSDRSQEKLTDALLRCQNLLNFDQSLKGLANDLDVLLKVSNNGGNEQLLQQSITNIKAALSEETRLLTTQGKGHRALSEWLSL